MIPMIEDHGGIDRRANVVRQRRVCIAFLERVEPPLLEVAQSRREALAVALALGLTACQKGFTVAFTTAAALVHQLMEARDERRLLKLQRGIHKPSAGHLSVDGKKTLFTCRKDSAESGIETIYQNTALVDSLSITRNIFMGRERCASGGMLKLGEMRDISMEVLKSAAHISGIDTPDMLVGELSGGQKQAVAIARAVFFKRRILMLDEPTSALSVRETEALLNQVLKLKSENVSSVFVTHNLYHAIKCATAL